jgi:histidine triad (HIT) family protein
MQPAMPDCVFCQIIAGTLPAPAAIVAQRDDAIAFEPLNPVVPGHLLVVPKQHVATFVDIPYVTGRTAAFAAEIALQRFDDCNLITSAGPYATQTIRHLHFHLVPRFPDDGLHLPWTNQG